MGRAPQYARDLFNREYAQYEQNEKKENVFCVLWVIPSLISLMVSVGVKHHVYLLTYFSGSSVWNSLPPNPKTYKSVRGFKVNLRKINE